ncbi:MAG: anthranilate phosphoribosyltransferase [Candidatus Omnitrophica bacterium]|nr:anthranilate phosphoribosyltransferase [Candidatus Omnitrophota bacterium]
MMRDYILKVEEGHNLSDHEIAVVMDLIMKGKAPLADLKRFLLALNKKGPTVEEITASARIMRKFVIPVKSHHQVILDTCGTGGDHRGTFNISTVVAIVTAACGVAVAKHGNRAVSSRCGSADVLEALGVNLQMEEKYLGECLDKIGLAFLFAQRLHPAMKNVALARQELGVKTIFNVLGPLTNPANATCQMMGVFSRDLVKPLAEVLKNLGLQRALVVHGHDGLDEITTTAKTCVCEFDGQEISAYDFDPEELGIKRAVIDDLSGGDALCNARIVHDILNGVKGPRRDIVVINAAFCLYAAGVVDDIKDGMDKAHEAIDAKRALKKLEDLKEFTCARG